MSNHDTSSSPVKPAGSPGLRPAEKPMVRIIKVVVTCTLLVLLALGVDWETLPGQVARLDWRFAGIGLVLVALEMVVNAWKWSYSLRLHDLRFRWIYLFRTGCFAYFFNNFLPSAIGGDVYRIYRTMTPGTSRSRAVSAVLIERLVGFASMIAIGGVGALWLMRSSELARWYLWGVSLAGVAALLILAFVAVGWLDGLRAMLSRVSWLEPVRDNLRRILRARREWIGLLVASCLFQLLALAVVYLAFAAAGSGISVAAAAVITAAAGIASVIPISISGLGVVEGTIAGTAVAIGVDYDSALIAALVVRLLATVVGAGGGLLYLTEDAGKRSPSSREMAA